MFSAIPAHAVVSQLEKLVMPGKLITGHAKYEDKCEKCHESFSKTDQSYLCRACHDDIEKDLKKKKGFHGKSKIVKNRPCKSCHTDHIGRNKDVVGLDKETFNHNQTDFKLNGKHLLLKCESCHKKGKKHRQAPGECYDCHKNDDAHKGKLGKKCHKCHSESGWKKIKFDHDKTDFPLKGKHEKASCESCHPDNRHKDTPKKCYACHAINDAHKGRYGKQCQKCHKEDDWSEPYFDHNKKTKFKLRYRHTKVLCDSCHTHKTGSIFKKHPGKQCIACHRDDDKHRGKNGKKCQKCHSEKGWKKTSFNHDRDTDFKIKGRHKKLKCTACHPSEKRKKKLKTDCYSCHRFDDVHKGKQGRDCGKCHVEKGWDKIIRFNHDLSDFPLLGQHSIIPCEECHFDNVFNNTSSRCASCHQKDDAHKKTLGTMCERCHNPNGWKLWRFDHNSETKFKLEYSHKGLKCGACHKDEMEAHVEQSPTCVVCHVKDDVHGGQFGNKCDQCHNTDVFDENMLLN